MKVSAREVSGRFFWINTDLLKTVAIVCSLFPNPIYFSPVNTERRNALLLLPAASFPRRTIKPLKTANHEKQQRYTTAIADSINTFIVPCIPGRGMSCRPLLSSSTKIPAFSRPDNLCPNYNIVYAQPLYSSADCTLAFFRCECRKRRQYSIEESGMAR